MTSDQIQICQLPQWFAYDYVPVLKRYGNFYDGGYLLNEPDLLESELLLSFGINDDWSFEKDIRNSTNLPILCYDRSISKNKFFRKILNSLLKPWQFQNIIHWVKVYSDYTTFFQGTTKHLEWYVGKKTKSNTFLELEDILQDLQTEKIFLKIDIEGSEYRILEEILFFEDKFTGIIIEFHDIDLHLEKIRTFIQSLKYHCICHIHANNFGEILTFNNMPQIIEITFTLKKNVKSSCFRESPHPHDFSNDKSSKDISIFFHQ